MTGQFLLGMYYFKPLIVDVSTVGIIIIIIMTTNVFKPEANMVQQNLTESGHLHNLKEMIEVQ